MRDSKWELFSALSNSAINILSQSGIGEQQSEQNAIHNFQLKNI